MKRKGHYDERKTNLELVKYGYIRNRQTEVNRNNTKKKTFPTVSFNQKGRRLSTF